MSVLTYGTDNPSARLPRPEAKVTIPYSPERFSECVQQAIDLLADSDLPLYQRQGVLVMLTHDSRGGPTGIENAKVDWLRLKLSQLTIWVTVNDEGPSKPRQIPRDLLGSIVEAADWPFPVLRGITSLPVLKADGSLHAEPGHDTTTGLVYVPGSMILPPQPSRPGEAEAREALDILLEALGDFPFASDADRSVALALIVTAVVRPGLEGCTPMFLITASTPGTGKSLLADLVSIIATGEPAARMAQANSTEMEKRITAQLISGLNLILIDNVSKPLRDSALDALVTSSVWRGRQLGASKMLTLDNRTVLMATGNNIQLGGDLGRRCLRVRMETSEEFPEERDGFTHPDLRGWARDNRPELVTACFTLVRGYILAGRPTFDRRAFGSFEEWSNLVRGGLIWLGQVDPVDTNDELRQNADQDRPFWEALLEAWDDIQGSAPVTSRELLDATSTSQPIRDALGHLLSRPEPRPRDLTALLKAQAGRIYRGRRVICAPRAANGVRFYVERIEDTTREEESPDLSATPFGQEVVDW